MQLCDGGGGHLASRSKEVSGSVLFICTEAACMFLAASFDACIEEAVAYL